MLHRMIMVALVFGVGFLGEVSEARATCLIECKLRLSFSNCQLPKPGEWPVKQPFHFLSMCKITCCAPPGPGGQPNCTTTKRPMQAFRLREYKNGKPDPSTAVKTGFALAKKQCSGEELVSFSGTLKAGRKYILDIDSRAIPTLRPIIFLATGTGGQEVTKELPPKEKVGEEKIQVEKGGGEEKVTKEVLVEKVEEQPKEVQEEEGEEQPTCRTSCDGGSPEENEADNPPQDMAVAQDQAVTKDQAVTQDQAVSADKEQETESSPDNGKQSPGQVNQGCSCSFAEGTFPKRWGMMFFLFLAFLGGSLLRRKRRLE